MALLQGGLSSSCLSYYQYDTGTQLLILTFRDKAEQYYYYNVPQPVFKAFMSAGSKGEFFNYAIRGVYE